MMRKRYAINLRFQLKYSLMAAVPILLLGFLIIAMVFNISKSVITFQKQQLMTQISFLEQALNFLNQKETNRKVIDDLKICVKNLKSLSQDLITINTFEWAGLNNTFFKGVITFAIGGLIFGIFLSHRVAGPIFRVQKILKGFATNANIPPIKIRPTDEFQEFYATLEEIRKTWVENKALRSEIVDGVMKKLDDLEEKGPGEISEAVKELKNEISKLKMI